MTVPTLAHTPPIGPPGAPLLVLGPSLGTASRPLWRRAVPALAERYRVTLWDLPGHGDSPATDAPFSVADLADAVAAVARDLGAETVLYAGVSLGGATGLELCLRHPQLVAGAAIVASAARLGGPDTWFARAAAVRAGSTSVVVDQSAARWFAPGFVAEHLPVADELLQSLRDADAESYARCCEALDGYDVSARLDEIALPVLALWGEHDAVAPVASVRELAAGVRRGRAEMIASAGHLPPAERPVETAIALREFFDHLGEILPAGAPGATAQPFQPCVTGSPRARA
jgi:3-oxoadipate enol-lactonase